jgi:hypothetical protein
MIFPVGSPVVARDVRSAFEVSGLHRTVEKVPGHAAHPSRFIEVVGEWLHGAARYAAAPAFGQDGL